MSIESIRAICADLQPGVDRRMVCPECNPHRRHKGRRDLSVRRTDKGLLYNCHHCGISGILKNEPAHASRKAPPARDRTEMRPLSPTAIAWLRDRGISRETAKAAGCFSINRWFRGLEKEAEAIGFPYRRDGEIYASKLRCLEAKDHTQIGSAETLWLLDQIGDLDRLYIVEGEIDALSMLEAGFRNVVSVPNGAPSTHVTPAASPEADRKFRYIWNSRELLDQFDEIYLCGDADRPGAILCDELARRLGKHRCWRVRWPSGCKDANDTLLALGAEGIRGAIESAERYPVAGLYEASAFAAEVHDLYVNGAGRGFSTGYYAIDEIFTILPGTLTVVTGVPASGKSEFLDQLACNMAEKQGWAIAMASFENEPRFHIAKLMQKRAGKHFFSGPCPRMTLEEMREHQQWVQEHFVFLYQADGSMATIEDIIERLKIAVVRHGIRMAVVDPINYVARDPQISETQWVGDTLTRLRVFAQSHDVALFLVAHPHKLQRREDGTIPPPKGYEVSGSANYINKTDFGLTVHVDDPQDRSQIRIINWKSRFSWAGRMGEAEIWYDSATTRYTEPPVSPAFFGN